MCCDKGYIVIARQVAGLSGFSPSPRKLPGLTDTGPGGVRGLILFGLCLSFSGKCFHPGTH